MVVIKRVRTEYLYIGEDIEKWVADPDEATTLESHVAKSYMGLLRNIDSHTCTDYYPPQYELVEARIDIGLDSIPSNWMEDDDIPR